jgi:integrase
MNYVEPIRDIKKISKMKKMMRKENKIKELTLFELGIKTGLRISDILAIRWNDVITESGFKDSVTIKEKKTSKSKIFRISQQVQLALKELFEIDNPEFEQFIF